MKQSSIKDNSIDELDIDYESIVKYNESILALDPLYSTLQPLSGYIVRVFLNEPTMTENGLMIPYRQVVSVPTQNGQAEFYEVDTPFPYSNKAVIVAAPQHGNLLKQGDTVQLGGNPVRTQAMGKGKNATVGIPTAYMHPSAKTLEIPQDINSQHYGYLLVQIQDIMVKLND